MENTSCLGPKSVVPEEVRRGWNWGGFFLTWIWGIGNSTFIAFLAFVPFVNLAMPFVLGAKGNAWAWQNKYWHSVEDFRATQRKWAIWGFVIWLVVVGAIGGGIFAIIASLKGSEAYRMSVAALNADAQAVAVLGQPIDTGIPQGSIKVSGPDGSANISYSAEGPKGEGKVYVEATKAMGQWTFDDAVFEDAATGERIPIGD